MPRRLPAVWPLVLASLVGASSAVRAQVRAGTEPGAETARLDLQLGLGRRDDALAAGLTRASADGSALSDLALAGVWFAPGGSFALGAAGRAAVERFALAPVDAAPGAARVVVTGLAARAGLALRARTPGGGLRAEGELGYGVLSLPVVYVDQRAGTLTLAGGALRAHGPGASVLLALALPAGLGLELGADATPRTFGARYRGVAVDAQRFGVKGGLSAGSVAAGSARLSAVLSAELSRASAQGDDVELTQSRRQISLGLRLSWPVPAVPRAEAPPVPPPPLAPPPPPVPSIITGLVRSESGQPLPAQVRIVELDLTVAADHRGAFRLDLRPGAYTLIVEAAGYQPQTKSIRAGSGEQSIYNIDLQAAPP